MELKDRLVEASKAFPAKFEEQRDGTLTIESKIAERKILLSRKTLTYRARLRVDDGQRTVRFFEILKESGIGISGGAGPGDMSPGFGFKKETYKTTGRGREGNIEELSKLFGKDYKYSWDYSTVRKAIEREAQDAGYSLSVCLNEKNV
ncbi:MAG: ribonucleoside-triphosphate reductase [archaeon]